MSACVLVLARINQPKLGITTHKRFRLKANNLATNNIQCSAGWCKQIILVPLTPRLLQIKIYFVGQMNLCELYTDVITAIHVGIAIGSKYWLCSAAALETAEEMTRKFF